MRATDMSRMFEDTRVTLDLSYWHIDQVRRILQCFMRKLWWLEMVNFIEVLEDIGCFYFWDVGLHVHGNLERIWH